MDSGQKRLQKKYFNLHNGLKNNIESVEDYVRAHPAQLMNSLWGWVCLSCKGFHIPQSPGQDGVIPYRRVRFPPCPPTDLMIYHPTYRNGPHHTPLHTYPESLLEP
jgi:hypothetical protein